eukprot:CAMPEP_0179886368 /NCGR_PEP_ID=MMETSP0982-20121206/30806_1 /TAXON_ID=483367 /ORGANISM="non described non described, Strain CCMP 2436" /LENGTH=73 /DNA_ID=CAMNT_0021782069 /DNA_START=726 /DNA_END=943 /DNA_ORIENTATION=+
MSTSATSIPDFVSSLASQPYQFERRTLLQPLPGRIATRFAMVPEEVAAAASSQAQRAMVLETSGLGPRRGLGG